MDGRLDRWIVDACWDGWIVDHWWFAVVENLQNNTYNLLYVLFCRFSTTSV